MEIAKKISLFFFIVATILAMIIASVNYIVEKKSLEQGILAHLITTTESRAAHVETLLDMYKSKIAELSESVILESFLKAAHGSPDYSGGFNKAVEKLRRISRISSDVNEVFLLSKEGVIVVSSSKDRIGLDRSQDQYFTEGKKGLFVKDIYYSKTSKGEALAVSAPITDKATGETLGVVVKRINLTGLNKILADRTGLGETGETYLTNEDFYMITPSRFIKGALLKLKVDTEQARRIREWERVIDGVHDPMPFLYKNYEGVSVLGTHADIEEMEWILFAEITEKEVLAPLQTLKALIAGILLIIPTISWLIGVVAGKAISRPIGKLCKGSEIIGSGNLDYRVGTNAKDEIGQLSRAFDQMTNNLKETTISVNVLNKEIEERRKAEEEIRRSKEYAELLYRVTPSAIFTVDREQRITSWNKKAEEITGYTYGEMLGEKCLLFAGEPCWDGCGVYDCNVKKPIYSKECTIKRKDNRLRVISKNADLLKDDKGEIIGAIESFEDITERKQANERIRQAANEWQRTFDSIADLIFIMDEDSNIVKGNKAFLDATKMKPEEIIGKKCYEILHRRNASWPGCPFRIMEKNRKVYSVEVDDADIGTPLLVTISLIFNEQGKPVGAVHIAKDISERRRLDELKDEFVGTVSHEMRTPLSIIKESVSLVLDEVPGKVSQKQRNILEMGKENIDRLSRIINDLLDISKIEAGKVELKKTLINMVEIIRKLCREWELESDKKEQICECHLPDSPVNIYADSGRVIQILNNLVFNAMKYASEKSLVTVELINKKNNIVLSVSDTGRGISKKDLRSIFTKFRQFGRVSGPGAKGTGLGLAITKSLVEEHGGTIKVESKLNKGTKFTVFLPKGAGIQKG